MLNADKTISLPRRAFLKSSGGAVALAAAGAVAGLALRRATTRDDMVWQIDPDKCVQCGRCATACVLTPSAVKCVHAYAICGYCQLCTGYFEPEHG